GDARGEVRDPAERRVAQIRRVDPGDQDARVAQRPGLRRHRGQIALHGLEARVAADRLEAQLGEPSGDLAGRGPVQVGELDPPVADPCDLAQGPLEVLRARLAHAVEHQADSRHSVSLWLAMKSRYQPKLPFGTRSSVG